MALCQQNVNRHAVIKKKDGGKWECGREPSELNHIRAMLSDGEEEEEESGRRETQKEGKVKTGRTGRRRLAFLSLSPLTLLREFSQLGKISADDTLVKMKTLRRLVDVTATDS